jgi:HAD superfamily hydrolase (TIGR01509 family)
MPDRLPPGKVPWELIADLVGGPLPKEVRLGPALGEDAALVEIGGELWALAADPITFTSVEAGRLAVVVNANDLAVRGARPRYLLAVGLIAPAEATPARVRELLAQLRRACDELGVALVGGHTEVAPGLAHSVIVGTMLGRVEGRPLTTGGLRAGDLVGMTRSAGLEGTAILLAEHGARLRDLPGFPGGTTLDLESAGGLSVVAEALAAAAHPQVSALHDVTEGGVATALHEMAAASGLLIEVTGDAIPVLPETAAVCEALGLDPLGLLGSGSLLVGCAAGGVGEIEAALAGLGVPLCWIGHARAGGEPRATLPRFARDELLKAGVMADIEALIFDMDGTLVASSYDWPAIRRGLGVAGPSIIDALNGLPEPERGRRWAELEAIESQASERAELYDGAVELLELLRGHGLATALVTNNTAANTGRLLERFGLGFDVVLTRDCGLWKPSGAPLVEAARRLGVVPGRCLGVGDSHYDLLAARDAGLAAVCMLHDGAGRHDGEADLSFPDIPALVRFLSVVLP